MTVPSPGAEAIAPVAGLWDALPTRAAALARLQAFLPRAGETYAHRRNTVTDDLGTVSRLSPYVRHRLLGEDEIVRAVLDRHAFASAQAFIHEVCWRTYWKGWLELRPGIWTRYRDSVQGALEACEADGSLRNAVDAAEQGRSGIDCFDAWARELVATGYLHNHARMWFASIWIFTLRLPWALGADFFLRHLLDGDAASNTLSWRWVAGMQTRGKHYLARADNIARFTEGRFNPAGQLDESTAPLPEDELPPIRSLAERPAPRLDLRSGLLLTEDDLHPESLPLPEGLRVIAVEGRLATVMRSPRIVAEAVHRFSEAGMDDALQRSARQWGVAAGRAHPGGVQGWIAEHRLEQVIVAEAAAGPAAEALETLDRLLQSQGVTLIRIRRPWDAAFWPQATRGFFQFRERIRPLLRELRIP